MNPLKIPDTNYTDFYDISRYNLSWKIGRLLFVSLLFVSVSFTIIEAKGHMYYSFGFLLSCFTLYWLYFSKKYKLVAYLLTICGLLLVSTSILFDRSALHIIEPLWLITLSIYAYFTIGKWYGNIILGVSTVVFVLFIQRLLNINLDALGELSNSQLYAMTAEFSICMYIVGYFVTHFMDSIQHAEVKIKAVNENLKAQNMIISSSNDEKTVLLQEIHHRVKNNLQVIVSLLRMQSHELTSNEAQVNFQEAINRVMTMALIHQRMYEERNLSELNVEEYFGTLINDLQSSYNINEVDVFIKSDLTKVGLKTIVPLGLLISELVSNSFKHAFKQSLKSEVRLEIIKRAENTINVIYSDSGKWIEPRHKSFGLELIETLTAQLEGEFQREAEEDGTTYTFTLVNLDV